MSIEAAQTTVEPTINATIEGGDGKTPATDGNPPPNGQDRVSSKMEVLIRREQQALRREQQARQREEALQAKLKEIEDREARIKEFDSVKQGNSKKALDLLGMNYDELTKSVLADGSIPPEVQIKRLEEKLQSFQSQQEEKSKLEQERQKMAVQAQEQKAISDFKAEIDSYVKENSGRYELIGFENKQDEIFKVIDEHYAKTIDPDTGVGVVMSMKEAADKVEEQLEQKYNKSRELKKIQAFLAQSQLGKAPVQGKKPEPQRFQPPRTLTNQMTATPTKRTTPLTDEERLQKAVAYARGLRPDIR